MQRFHRFCVGLCLLALSLVSVAAETWVFLKDGRYCLSPMTGDPLVGRVPDGGAVEFSKEMIQGTRSVEQVEKAVNAMIAEMAAGKNFDEHGARFKVFRASAVPALLKHLANEPLNERLAALYGLCFSWSKAALEPVLKDVRDNNPQMSRAAYSALERNVPALELGKLVKDLADDPDISKAIMVFRAVDQAAPDPSLKRIRRLLANAEGRSAAAPYLSHYYSSELVPDILELLASQKIDEQRSALCGLIAASASDDATRARVAPLLRASDADLRQLAGEFFTRCGARGDVEKLREASAAEQNVYAKACFDAAIRLLNSRAEKIAKLPDTLSARWKEMKDSDPAETKLKLCLDVLKGAPGLKDFSKAREVLRASVLLEPHHWYSGNLPEWHDGICLKNCIERLLDGAPCGALESADESSANTARAADKFVPPIDAYFDPKRKSFGFQIPLTGGLYGDSVHIGDDCGWHRELRTIVSTANGVVRRVGYVPSWGHILIIEHTLKDGARVCSLYGHVSPFIYVKAGDVVEAGQKIAAIGRENTIENGGYGAHLHFGIHTGAYNPSTWICGYLSKPNFAGGKHGWLNPQMFLEEHRQ